MPKTPEYSVSGDDVERERTWQEYAKAYDAVLLRMPFYCEVVARHVEAMTRPEVRTVLDLGAGTGNVTMELVKIGRQVTAVDSSPSMLDCLRAKLRIVGSTNPIIIRQSAESLPQFADGSFDAVNMLLVLYAVAQPWLALKEALRVLRPGGVLVITEPKRCFRLQTLMDFAEEYLREHSLYDQLHEDWQRVAKSNQRFDPSRRSSLWVEEIYDYLRAKGYQQMTSRDSHLGNCATLCARRPDGQADRKCVPE